MAQARSKKGRVAANRGESVAMLNRLRLFEKALLPLVLTATLLAITIGALPISRLSVEAHSGRIWAEHATPKGSRFPFVPPIAGAAGD